MSTCSLLDLQTLGSQPGDYAQKSPRSLLVDPFTQVAIYKKRKEKEKIAPV